MEHQKLHFIGIGGIGMSGIARIMLDMGYQISGSDMVESALVTELRKKGAVININHHEDNLPPDCEAVVYSSAVKKDNPEMIAAQKRELPIYKRAEMLAFLMQKRISVGVAGAHGKTTTSAMISLMLEETGNDPTIIIGGTLPQINNNAKSGSGNMLIAEADESDGTFLLLKPKIAVITNIESDHLDFYPSLVEIKEAFLEYLENLPEDGFAIVNMDCPNTFDLIKKVNKKYISYGFNNEADYVAKNLGHNDHGAYADIYEKGKMLGCLELNVFGNHNISNALAAIALGRYLEIPFSDIKKALACFTGTGRRFEYLGEKKNNIRVFDDYAHHPTEIEATLKAARDRCPKRLVCVFQPHRYSRTQAMYKEFAKALTNSDLVIINEIYPAFEKPIPGVSATLIMEAAKSFGYDNIFYAGTQEEVLDLLDELTEEEDLLLIMGAGNIRSTGEKFLEK